MLQKLQKVLEKINKHPKISIGIGTALVFAMLARHFQTKIIYLPKIPSMSKSPSGNPEPYRNPANYGMDKYTDIQIQTSDKVKLRGWYIFQEQNAAGHIILYFHENAGNIGYRLPFIKKLMEYTKSNVLIVPYRGYSDSDGSPSEGGLKKDGIAILRKAIQIADNKKLRLVVFGRSLGGAVAINTLSHPQFANKVQGLILENTFTSIKDVSLHLFSNRITKPFIILLLFFLLSNHWQSYKLINKIKCKTLFIKSTHDQLIPIKQMDELQRRSRAQEIEEYKIRFGTHNQTWVYQQKQYFRRWSLFLSKL